MQPLTRFGFRPDPLAVFVGVANTEGVVKRRAPKLVLIDDDQIVVRTLSAVLSSGGYQVFSALDPVQGFMAVRREKPQIVLLDIMMPAGGGFPLLKRLTEQMNVPVIVITALTDPTVEANAKAAGAAGLLKKPIDPEALKQLIEELLAPEQ